MKNIFTRILKRSLKNRGINLKLSTIIMLLLGNILYGTAIDEESNGIKLEFSNGKYYYSIGDKRGELGDNILEINGNIYANDFDKSLRGIKIDSSVINENLDIIINGDVKIDVTDWGNFLIDNSGSVGNIVINGNFETVKSFINYGIANSGSIKGLENNGILKSEADYLIRNSGALGKITNNNNMIMELTSTDEGKLIYNGGLDTDKSKISNIENNGIMKMVLDENQESITRGDIIHNAKGKEIGSIKNNGILSTNIIVEKQWGIPYITGIYSDGKIDEIENNGIVEGFVQIPRNSYYIGIELSLNGKLNRLRNNGIIYSGSNDINNPIMYGVYSYRSMQDFINKGLIYGKRRAVLGGGYNYGLLINGTEDTSSAMKVNGLEIKINEVKDYTLVSGEFGKENIESIDGIEYKIKNAQAKKSSEKIVGTESINLSGDISNTIYNGITDTVKIEDTVKFDNVVVNGYKSSIIFGENGGDLTLNNSVVNGGIDRIYTDDGNLLSASPIIKGSEKEDTLTILGDTKLNGKIDLSSGKDTINFGGEGYNSNITIFHNIEGTENININENTTFFETSHIYNAENIKIARGKELGLKLKVEDGKITHSLTGNNGLKIVGEGSKENTGKINFISSELGEDSKISIEGIEVDNVAFGTSSILDTVKVTNGKEVEIEIGKNLGDVVVNPNDPEEPINPENKLPENINYESLNKIYKSILANSENVTELKKLLGSDLKTLETEQEKYLVNYLAEIYTSTPYSLSSELSRKSIENLGEIIANKDLKPTEKKWSIYGGFTHLDGDVENIYYGQNKYSWDNGYKKDSVENKMTGLYTFGEYGIKEDISLGVIFGANNLESSLSNGSKVDGTAIYLGGFVKKYMKNLRLLAGIGYQYGDYEIDRYSLGADMVRAYNSDYNDKALNLYTDIKYSHVLKEKFYLEPSIRLNYTHISQDGADESGKLSIKTDSKDFDYMSLRVGMDIRKDFYISDIKQSFSLGSYYEKMIDGDENEKITGRFSGGSDFNILVAGKNKDRVGLIAKYETELENGISFDLKGDYSFERSIYIGDMKHTDKGEWRIGAGLGYRF